MENKMKKMFISWRIRAAKEKVAYWRTRADYLKKVCSKQHLNYEREDLIDAASNLAKYEARLGGLQDYIKETT